MNNKPITARVKSGMFKTKEPLLNVGPAGVDGNNQTRTMPSPSKMKGYKMKSSPFKQNAITDAEKENKATIEMSSEQNNAGVNANTNQESTVIQKGKEGKAAVPGKVIKASTERCGIEVPMSDPRCIKYNKMTPEEIRKSEVKQGLATEDTPAVAGTPDKVVKTNKKGTSKIYEQSEGQAQSAYDRRNNARAGRRTDREVNRYSRKLGKYGTYDQEGEFTQRKDLSQREIRKMGIAKNALERANKESENVSQQSLQNVGGFSGKNVRNIDRRKTKGGYTKEEQAEMTDDDGKKSKTTNTSKTSSFKKPKPINTDIGFTPMSMEELSAGLENRGGVGANPNPVTDGYDPITKTDNSIAKMGNKGFFKKKSPMKMNYFKK